MATPAKAPQANMIAIGTGVTYAVVGNELLIRVPLDEASLKAAPRKPDGVMHLVGNSGGFQSLAGTEAMNPLQPGTAIRASVMVGYKDPAAARARRPA